MQEVNKFALKAAGEAGSGVMTVGAIMTKAMRHAGLHVFYTNDFPSLIKGGHNTCYVRADDEELFSMTEPLDVVVAFNKNAVIYHLNEIKQNGAIIYDADRIKLAPGEVTRTDVKLLHVPMNSMALKAGGALYANMVPIGAVTALIGLDFAFVEQTIQKNFGKKGKGEEIAAKNIQVAKEGYDYVKNNYKEEFRCKIENRPVKGKTVVVTGNEAACIGAIKAGAKFVAEYPMSPSSGILHFMAAHERTYNIVVKHTEDEIAAANMIIGAAFTGVRAMTGTSGGGFALMVEALGMSGLNETPIVIFESQRVGPSTGMPTYSEQADLLFAVHASQGEFPRIIVAPGDVNETFFESFNAFNLADQYQVPVIVLLDKFLSDTAVALPPFDTSGLKINRGKLMSDDFMNTASNFKRHELTSDGISPRCVPGQKNGIHVCSSYEHDEYGWTIEDAHMRKAQVDKRARKMNALSEDVTKPRVYGNQDADVSIICWGSTKMSALEALKELKKEGIKANVLHFVYLEPFPTKSTEKFLKKCKNPVIVEMNSQGQLHQLIRKNCCIRIKNELLKYDGRPFFPLEIINKVKEVLKNG